MCWKKVVAGDNEKGGLWFSGPPKPIVLPTGAEENAYAVAEATPHPALTHTLHKIARGWDAGGLVCENVPVVTLPPGQSWEDCFLQIALVAIWKSPS